MILNSVMADILCHFTEFGRIMGPVTLQCLKLDPYGSVCDRNVAQRINFLTVHMTYNDIPRDYWERQRFYRGIPHSTAKIRPVQHWAATLAIAELLLSSPATMHLCEVYFDTPLIQLDIKKQYKVSSTSEKFRIRLHSRVCKLLLPQG